MIEAHRAREAASQLLSISENQRNASLTAIAEALELNIPMILAENAKDVAAATSAGLSDAKIDRLRLTQARLEDMAASVKTIAQQEAVVGIVDQTLSRDDGLEIHKQRVPIGVLAMIFESRPNVVIDCSALAIKSGNAIILKGGKEAACSNRALYQLVASSCEGYLPEFSVQLIEQRRDVVELLKQADSIDLVIPRGGEGLVSYVEEHARMPVLAHHKGLCHTYIHASANLDKAKAIVLNAKTQRPGVCNAMETLLLDQALPEDFVQDLYVSLQAAGVELRLDPLCPRLAGAKQTNDDDWDTEYLDLTLSIKCVANVEQACAHIAKHGSQHTEAILALDPDIVQYFQTHVDASAIMVNASSRFNDGGEFQLGAELGISTTKLHAYGPMGAKEMTICRHLVVGDGHIRN